MGKLATPVLPEVNLMESDDGDWEGLYINGVLVLENHSLSAHEVLREIARRLSVIKFSTSTMLEGESSCPSRLKGRKIDVFVP